MTNTFRAMCAELLVLAEESPSYRVQDKEAVQLIDRARALLAQPVPEVPTDEELLRAAATAIEPYEISGITPGEYEPETECAVEAYGSELIAYARAVLARWGNPTPQPPADGEVGELVECLRIRAASLSADGASLSQRERVAIYFTRAAELLESQ